MIKYEDLIDGTMDVFAINLKTNQKKQLTTRNDSHCSFFEHYSFDNTVVQHRLDWKDLDNNGFPTLDADFYIASTNKKINNTTAKASHHTRSSENNMRVYKWNYLNENIEYQVTVTFRESIEEMLNLQADCDATVIKGKDK